MNGLCYEIHDDHRLGVGTTLLPLTVHSIIIVLPTNCDIIIPPMTSAQFPIILLIDTFHHVYIFRGASASWFL